MIAHQAQISAPAVTHAIDESLAFLRATFRTFATNAGDEYGWYHYLDDDRPGITASAVALFCFANAGKPFERTDDVVDYLVANQITAARAEQLDSARRDLLVGGWPVRSTRGVPILEATAWVVRALSHPANRPLRHPDAVRLGSAWLLANQNDDNGWGSRRDEPSRVFHTCLAIAALAECGASADAIAAGADWLLRARDASQAAWGPVPQAEPTLLHTAYALRAFSRVPNAIAEGTFKEGLDWLGTRLVAGQHTELLSENEEFTIDITRGTDRDEFQNSLPHFAGPIALETILRLGDRALTAGNFECVNALVADQSENGTWTLPRNPARPSIWAMWPFVSALCAARDSYALSPSSQVYLIFDGVVLRQTEDPPLDLSLTVLARRSAAQWMKARSRRIALLTAAAIAFVLPLVLFLVRSIDVGAMLLALLAAPALAVVELLVERRTRPSTA